MNRYCPKCKAMAGQPCIYIPTGKKFTTWMHPERKK